MPVPIANLDWHVALVDAVGAAFGTVGNPITTTVTGGGSAASATDEAPWTAGSSLFNPTGGVFNDSAAALTSGQQGTLRLTPNRAGHANLRSQNGTEILPVPAALGDTDTNPTTIEVGAMTMFFNGTTGQWARARAATSVADGALGGTFLPYAPMVNNGGTAWERARSVLGATGTSGTGVPAAGPVNLAVAHGANPTAVTAAQFVAALANRAGIPFVIGGHPNIQTIRVNYTAAQTDTAIITIAAGTKIVVTGFLVTAANSNTVDTVVRIGFGTVSTPTGSQVVGSHPGVAAGSGFGRGGGAGIIGVGADDEDLRITSSVPTGGSIDCDVSYYTVPS